jgi:hypothetical protein
MRLCRRLWPRSQPHPTRNDATAAAHARSNAPGTTTSRSRNPASPPAPATPDPRPSASGPYSPTPGHTPRRVRTHWNRPGSSRTSTKKQSRRPAVTPDHRPNVTSPARRLPARHTAPADATALQKHHRPAAQRHDQLKLRGIGARRRSERRIKAVAFPETSPYGPSAPPPNRTSTPPSATPSPVVPWSRKAYPSA